MNYHLTDLARSDGDPVVLSKGPSSLDGADRLARFLGWFSIGLGATELLAPGLIAGCLGMRGKKPLLRAFGVRELMAGVLTLSVDKQLGLWSRLAGDALDIAALTPALNRRNPERGRAAMTLLLLGGIAALDGLAAQAISAKHAQSRGQRRSYRDRSGFPQGVDVARRLAKERARSATH